MGRALRHVPPSAIGDEAIITVDATTAGGVDPEGRITWRPFTVADAWEEGPQAGTPWHEYYGVVADGLVWLGSRPYDPTTRQFLATDPQAPAPGKAGGASPYTYAANDPINLFDPSGNSPISMTRSTASATARPVRSGRTSPPSPSPSSPWR